MEAIDAIEMPSLPTTDTVGIGGHPRGLTTLFFTEMWERFSYYGMRAILILYMTAAVAEGGLGFDTVKAGKIYRLYTSSVYLTTLGGGWLADRVFGRATRSIVGRDHYCLRSLLDGLQIDAELLRRSDFDRRRAQAFSSQTSRPWSEVSTPRETFAVMQDSQSLTWASIWAPSSRRLSAVTWDKELIGATGLRPPVWVWCWD